MDDRRTMLERMFTGLVAVTLAVVFVAIFVGSVTTNMMELQTMTQEQGDVRKLVSKYFEHTHISRTLIANVKRHLTESSAFEKEQEKEAKILSFLPQKLHDELLFEMHTPVLQRHALMGDLISAFPRVGRHLCASILQIPTLARCGEEVFEKGDPCNRMLFVDRGSLWYSQADTEQDPEAELIVRAQWLSEPAVWMMWENQGRLLAETHSCLLALDGVTFAQELLAFKEVYALAVVYGRDVLKDTRSRSTLTDLPTFSPLRKQRNKAA